MSSKERARKGIFEMVKQGCLTLKQAARQGGISYRQARRIYQAYLKQGDAGLIHKHRVQQSNRKHPHQEKIINRYKEKYEGFGPTLASEYLSREGYNVDHETLRRWLISESLWVKQFQKKRHHPRRERRAQFGELLQIDGSIQDWLDEHSPARNHKHLGPQSEHKLIFQKSIKSDPIDRIIIIHTRFV